MLVVPFPFAPFLIFPETVLQGVPVSVYREYGEASEKDFLVFYR
jgi:hypothetical protein